MEIKKSYMLVIRFNIYYIIVTPYLEIKCQGLYGINIYHKYIPVQPMKKDSYLMSIFPGKLCGAIWWYVGEIIL